MVERNQNRMAHVISNASVAVNRVIEDIIDQLDNIVAASRRDTRRRSTVGSTQSSDLTRSLSRNAAVSRKTSKSRPASAHSKRQSFSAEMTKSPYLETAERPTSAIPSARLPSLSSNANSQASNRPRTMIARDNSSFDDTSAGSGRVSTAVSPMNERNKMPKTAVNAVPNERRGRSPTVKTNTNSQPGITPRTAWANVSVGGHAVIRPRSTQPPSQATRTPSTGLSPFSAKTNGSSTPFTSSRSPYDMSTARPPHDPQLTALRRGKLFGRSGSSPKREMVYKERSSSSLPAMLTGTRSSRSTSTNRDQSRGGHSAHDRPIPKGNEPDLKTAIPIGSPCGRRTSRVPQGPSAVSTEKMMVFKSQKPSKALQASTHSSAVSEPVTSSARTPNVKRPSTASRGVSPIVVQLFSLDSSIPPRNSTSSEPVTSRAVTPIVAMLGSGQPSSTKATTSPAPVESTKPVANISEFVSPTSASGRQPLTGFDREHWNLARNDNSDTAVSRLATARERSQDTLQVLRPNVAKSAPMSPMPSKTKSTPSKSVLTKTPVKKPTSKQTTPSACQRPSQKQPTYSHSPTRGVKTAREEPRSPTRDVATAREVPMSPTRDVKTADEVRSSPTHGVLTAYEIPTSPTRDVATANEVPMSPTRGVNTANEVPTSPTHGVATANEVPMSPTRGVNTANEVRTSPTRDVHTANEVPMSPTRGVNTAREATMTPTKGVKTAISPGSRPKTLPTTPTPGPQKGKALDTAKTPKDEGRTNIISAPIYTPRPISLPITRAYSIPPTSVYGDANRDALLTPKVRRGLFGTPVDNRAGTPMQNSAFSASSRSLSGSEPKSKSHQSFPTARRASRTPSPYCRTGSIKTMRSAGNRRPIVSGSRSRSSSNGSVIGSQGQLPYRSNRCTVNSIDRSLSGQRSANRSQSGRRLAGTAQDKSMSTPKRGLSTGSSFEDRYERNRTGRIPTGSVTPSKNATGIPKPIPSQPDQSRSRVMKPALPSDLSKKSVSRSSKSNSPWVSARTGAKDRKLSNEASSKGQPLTAVTPSKPPKPTGGSREGRSGKSFRSRDSSRPSFYGSSRRARKSNKRNIKKPSKPVEIAKAKEQTSRTPSQEPTQQASPDTRSDIRDVNEKKNQATAPLHTAINDTKPQRVLEAIPPKEITSSEKGGNIVIHQQNEDGTIKLEVHLSCRMNSTGVLKISGRAPSGIHPKKVIVNGKEIWTES